MFGYSADPNGKGQFTWYGRKLITYAPAYTDNAIDPNRLIGSTLANKSARQSFLTFATILRDNNADWFLQGSISPYRRQYRYLRLSKVYTSTIKGQSWSERYFDQLLVSTFCFSSDGRQFAKWSKTSVQTIHVDRLPNKDRSALTIFDIIGKQFKVRLPIEQKPEPPRPQLPIITAYGQGFPANYYRMKRYFSNGYCWRDVSPCPLESFGSIFTV